MLAESNGGKPLTIGIQHNETAPAGPLDRAGWRNYYSPMARNWARLATLSVPMPAPGS
jgi:hypothetical protein